jgi:hypothetical protein
VNVKRCKPTGRICKAVRGWLARRFREEFTKAFERYSGYPAKVLKGKHPARILWAVANPDNVDEVASWIGSFVGSERG